MLEANLQSRTMALGTRLILKLPCKIMIQILILIKRIKTTKICYYFAIYLLKFEIISAPYLIGNGEILDSNDPTHKSPLFSKRKLSQLIKTIFKTFYTSWTLVWHLWTRVVQTANVFCQRCNVLRTTLVHISRGRTFHSLSGSYSGNKIILLALSLWLIKCDI
jgi:flagellar biosynthesis protein FlhB